MPPALAIIPDRAGITLTVHIDLGSGPLPPGAAELIDSLRALAALSEAPRPARLSLVPPTGPDAGAPVLRVDEAARTVECDGRRIRLTRREFDLLAYLGGHPRRVFSRAHLLRQVWGYEAVSGERTVDVHVRRLRAKLGARGPVVCTVRGIGYRLDEAARVSFVTEPAQPASSASIAPAGPGGPYR